MLKRLVLAVLAVALPLSAGRAGVSPHPLFTDGMVLQQGTACRVWGDAAAGEAISFSLDAGPQSTASKQPVSADADGKWRFTPPVLKAGGPFTLTISGKTTVTIKDVYVGEVWVASGQSNMGMTVNASAGADEARKNAKNPKLRLFTVKHNIADAPHRTVPVDRSGGRWREAGPDTIGTFSAVAYYFGRELQQALDVPVGIIHTSYGGTRAEAWTSRRVLEADPIYRDEFPDAATVADRYQKALDRYKSAVAAHEKAVARAKAEGKEPPRAPRPPAEPGKDPNAASVLYNGMIAPLVGFGIKGVIWYQGEANTGRAEEYANLFPMMIRNWRDDWKQGDFPFLFVQLAPYQKIEKEPSDTPLARLRESQLVTARKVKDTAMAVITDVGDEDDIHPKRKEPVGHRLALAAEALAYGQKVESSGPVFDKMTVEGSRAVLSFTHVGSGLEAKDGPLTGFTVAGQDRKFYSAEAEIKGDTVVVWSKQVEKPAAVRFGWANYPVVNLCNRDGLPASPFRTDSWERSGPGRKPKK
jgi:sialate O-acetylesterase